MRCLSTSLRYDPSGPLQSLTGTQNTSRGWREVMVDIADPKKDIIVSSTPKLPLRLVLAPTPTPASTLYTRLSSLAAPPAPGPVSLSFDTTLPLPTPQQTPSQSMSPTLSRFDRLPEGSRMEISPASWEVVRALGKLVSANTVGGAGLIVDYGDGKGFGRSWRVRLPSSCSEAGTDQ